MVPFRILGRILCELTGSCRILWDLRKSCRILENPVGSCIGFLPGILYNTLILYQGKPCVNLNMLVLLQWMTPASAVSKCTQQQIKLGIPQIYEMSRFCQWAIFIWWWLANIFMWSFWYIHSISLTWRPN